MDKTALNAALKQNKIVSADKLEALEKDLLQLKTPEPWEDFLLEKKILDGKDTFGLKSAAFRRAGCGFSRPANYPGSFKFGARAYCPSPPGY